MGKVIFGYQHGFKKGFKLDSSKIAAVKIFLNGKSAEKRTLIVGEVFAAGAAGEKPPVDPSRIVVKPKGGVISETPFQVKVGQKSLSAVLKPNSGYWNLGDYLKVTAAVINTGKKPITPKLTVDSSGGKISATAGKMIKPGASGRVEVCFIPEKPWFAQGEGKDVKPIGGTKFESHRVRSLLFGAVEPQGEYEVMSVKCEKVTAKIPSWLGRRPPVPGKWKQTLSEEFNNSSLNEKIWSPYSSNYWDKRTHFTRDNIIFRDGCCVLRYEKKRGAKNDDPALGETDYACGILDSFGKWTQLYGYFEARMKLPTKPGLWPAFWTMPDRGASAGSERWMRADTNKGGMEFDIMEYLTTWGPYRFNVACHWDGYGKYHRSLGTTCVYMPTDEDGFITVGMLWLPGVWAIYGNGVELARWESARVSNVPAHIFFYMVSGGWANEPLNDDELPDEFQVDWFRVWQREDLVD
jgi:beta-glucanase (GH16 family)